MDRGYKMQISRYTEDAWSLIKVLQKQHILKLQAADDILHGQ